MTAEAGPEAATPSSVATPKVDSASAAPPSPAVPQQQPIYFLPLSQAAREASVQAGVWPIKAEVGPEKLTEEAKRRRALQLYSDLSEIDQQDKDGQKTIRLREPVDPDGVRGLTSKFRVLEAVRSQSDSSKKTDSSGSPTFGAKVVGGAAAMEESLRQEALRQADARAKKHLRRRLLARLYREKTAGRPEDDTDSQDEEEEEDREKQLVDDGDNLGGVSGDGVKSDKDGAQQQCLERRLLSQMSSGWRQRRLLYNCRRRRFRSGLDMIHRRHRKKSKPDPSPGPVRPTDETPGGPRVSDDQRGAFPAEGALKVFSDGGAPPEMKRLMVNKALGETILHRAARQSYLEVVLYCLEMNCCDVNARDNAGYTPLHECCSRGHLQAARTLLQYGADVNASAAGGIRPLHDAVENDHVECARLLLSYGADPTIATYSGLSPIKLSRSPVMTEFLRGYMADISGDSSDGHPVLPWQFHGSASCLDPSSLGYNALDGVPSDEDLSAAEGEGEESGRFLFEVSDSPLLPSFRLYLPPPPASARSPDAKVLSNCLRLSDVLKQTGMKKEDFRRFYSHLELVTVPRHEFEAGAACSQLLTGTRLDKLLATAANDEDPATIDVLRLDNKLRTLLGIETITLR